MKQRTIWLSIALGSLGGILGTLFTLCGLYFPKMDVFADFREFPVLALTFFVGVVPGLIAGAVAAVGRVLIPIVGLGGVATVIPATVGTVLSTLFAASVKKWVFFGKRPPAMMAALFAVLASVVTSMPVVAAEISHETQSYSVIFVVIVVQCAANGVCIALASLLFRVVQPLKANVIAGVSIVALSMTVMVVWFFQGRVAINKVTEMTKAVGSDAMVALDYPIEPEMLRVAHLETSKAKVLETFAKKDLDAIAKKYKYELVAVADNSGKIIAANDPVAIGFSVASKEETRDLVVSSEDNARWRTVPFQPAVVPSSVKSDAWVKYVSLGIPDGGMLILGERVHDDICRARDYLFEAAAIDWHVGARGHMMVVDGSTGKIVSGFTPEETGKSVAETGLKHLARVNDELMKGIVNGEAVFVRRCKCEFLDLEVYIMMPVAEVMAPRDVAASMACVLLSIVFIFGAFLLAKIAKQSRDIADMRAKEDERLQKDMDLARHIQLSSLPTEFPAGVHAFMRTAKEVGGDFYDCFFVSPNRMMCVVADVSGKGIPAAMFMMRARTEIRAVSKETQDISTLMAEVNSRLCANNIAEMFVTAWLGILDTDSGELVWSSAGHNPPYVVRADGKVEQLVGKRSLVFAGMSGVGYNENSLHLECGDRVFLYTDGVTEAQSENGDFFGEDRLERRLSVLRGGVADICNGVVAAVDMFAGNAPQADDITVMAIERLQK